MKISSEVFMYFLSAIIISSRTCGVIAADKLHKDPTGQIAHVVGGDPANAGEYPYFVLLGGCGGSLISPTVVLTAAHCDPNYYIGRTVTVGATDRYSLSNGSFQSAERINVKDAVAHPRYGMDGSNINNDFALLLLSSPYNIESNIKLVLNEEDSVPADGDILDVFGMGTTQEGGNIAESLRDVKVPAISNNQCNAYYFGGVTDKMVCAGYPEGNKDACQGDSGGPLVKKVGNTHYQIGVTSWGDGCARENRPGVYARVSKEVAWIKSMVCDNWEVQGSDLCGPPAPTAPPTNPPGCDSTSQFKINLNFDNYSEDISWKITSGQEQIAGNSGYSSFESSAEETIALCNNKCYTATINDSFGDGLCCEQGVGSYKMEINGNVISEGGQFGDEVMEEFCLDENGDITSDLNIKDDDDDEINCKNDPEFRFKNKKNKNCDWVAKKPFGKKGRCKKKFKGVKVHTYCPEACDKC